METELGTCPDDGATTVAVQVTAETYDPGTIINDRYRIDEVLGIGGFGAVYMCTQANMDQVVAVKVLKSEHLTSVEHVKRFTREAQAASKLKHPNTISIFDFGTHSDGALYLAMEYLHGETFANRMDEQTCMKPTVLVHIMSQICHSLTEAHKAGLIHRDLKPENIMLLPVAGDPNFVKVLDFGIAKFEKERNEGEERLTEAGMIMGTPTYMSPEQARGEALDARSDIYALGVMMYEAVCGRVPFDGDQPMTVLVKHIKDPPEPPRAVAPEADIPRSLEKVILRCLEKQPDHRPQTAAELAEAVVKALNTPDSVLRKLTPEDHAELEVDDSEQPTESIPGVPSAREMMHSATATMPDDAPRPRATPGGASQQTRNRSRLPLWVGLGAFAVVGVVAVIVAMLEFPTPAKSAAPAPPTVVQEAPAAAVEPALKVATKEPSTVPTPAPAPPAAPKADAVATPTSEPAVAQPTGGEQPAGVKTADPNAVEAPKAAPVVPAKTAAAAPTVAPQKPKAGGRKGTVARPPVTAKSPPKAPATAKPAAGASDDFRLPD